MQLVNDFVLSVKTFEPTKYQNTNSTEWYAYHVGYHKSPDTAFFNLNWCWGA